MEIKYTWVQFYTDIEALVNKGHLRAKNIYGLSLQAMVPSAILADKLGITLNLNSRKITERTLIVDCVSGTGNTLSSFTKRRTYYKTMALWIAKDTIFTPDIFIRTKQSNDTIIFPWE